MIKYLEDFYNKIGLGTEETKCYMSTYKLYESISEVKEKMDYVLNEYNKSINCDYQNFIKIFDEIALITNTHKFSAYAIYLSILSKRLKEYYKERGIDEEVFYETMKDIKYKTYETYSMYDFYGVFCGWWYDYFFMLKRFSFGLIQVEEYTYDLKEDFIESDTITTFGDKALNIHIPRTLKKLDHNEVKAEYKKARDFFKYYTKSDNPIFMCCSWLLFKRHKELGENSNIYKFYKDFRIMEDHEFDDYHELMRVFNKEYNGNISSLNAETSLQKFYKGIVERGEKIGFGIGVFKYKD